MSEGSFVEDKDVGERGTEEVEYDAKNPSTVRGIDDLELRE